MKRNNPLPGSAVAIVVVVVLSSIMIDQGWLLALPALLVFFVVASLWGKLQR